MIYRSNLIDPPRFKTEAQFWAESIVEVSCRKIFSTSGSKWLLATHILGKNPITEAVKLVKRDADNRAKFLRENGVVIDPLGSGDREADDDGGLVMKWVDLWALSFLRSKWDENEIHLYEVKNVKKWIPWFFPIRALWNDLHLDYSVFLIMLKSRDADCAIRFSKKPIRDCVRKTWKEPYFVS